MGKVIIDEERCKGCQLCVEICPKHILTIAESTNSFGYQPARVANDEECTGCALCAQMCPDLAIEVYK
ncbi:4Fe-4S binding protein [bacterium]|nr:4Fe-4S binding protein [bacterium]MCK4326562.1 4Fe-4S binding protein [bacterium]